MNNYDEFPNYPVVFACCDTVYFQKYAPAFVSSLNAIGKDVHIHIMDWEEHDVTLFKKMKDKVDIKFTLTLQPNKTKQRAEERRTYYACSRFIVLPTLLKSAGKVMVLDIDMLIMKDFDFPEKSIGYVPREPLKNTSGWEKRGTEVLASVTYFTKDSMDYVLKIREKILQGPFKWFLDQVVLTEVLKGVDSHHYDIDFSDWEFSDHTTIWTGKGPRKWENKKYVKQQKKFEEFFA